MPLRDHEPKARLRCRIGWHAWGRWTLKRTYPRLYSVENDGPAIGHEQERSCVCCHFVQRKIVWNKVGGNG